MSWGYWGIVTGLLVLVTVFFFSIDLFYRGKKTPSDELAPDKRGATHEAGSRHAA
jgi:hypothetical protein